MTKQGLLEFDAQVTQANQGGLFYTTRARLSPVALQSQKEAIMPNSSSTTVCLTAVQSYLEEEFPGRVEASRDNVIGVSHDGIRHHVVLQPTFLNLCPDYRRAIRESELADYMREARSQARRFLVIWQERDIRIRSKPM